MCCFLFQAFAWVYNNSNNNILYLTDFFIIIMGKTDKIGFVSLTMIVFYTVSFIDKWELPINKLKMHSVQKVYLSVHSPHHIPIHFLIFMASYWFCLVCLYLCPHRIFIIILFFCNFSKHIHYYINQSHEEEKVFQVLAKKKTLCAHVNSAWWRHACAGSLLVVAFPSSAPVRPCCRWS